MAVLPGGRYVIQQVGGTVILFDSYDDRNLVTFNPADANAVAQAQKHIHDLEELDAERKCFAHLWSGYFYAHATSNPTWHQPQRGDGVEALIKQRRDSYDKGSIPWDVLEDFLDDYRLMADMGQDVGPDGPFSPGTEAAVTEAIELTSEPSIESADEPAHLPVHGMPA